MSHIKLQPGKNGTKNLNEVLQKIDNTVATKQDGLLSFPALASAVNDIGNAIVVTLNTAVPVTGFTVGQAVLAGKTWNVMITKPNEVTFSRVGMGGTPLEAPEAIAVGASIVVQVALETLFKGILAKFGTVRTADARQILVRLSNGIVFSMKPYDSDLVLNKYFRIVVGQNAGQPHRVEFEQDEYNNAMISYYTSESPEGEVVEDVWGLVGSSLRSYFEITVLNDGYAVEGGMPNLVAFAPEPFKA